MSESTTQKKVINFKLSTGIRRAIISDEDSDFHEHSGARELPEHGALATSSQQKSPPIEKTSDTEKSEGDELFDVSRTWAFGGKKGSPVATEEITRLSKTVFSQSMGNGVTFPVRYFCPELKDIRENRVFIYDARSMICAKHFFWREDCLKFENERTVLLPKYTNFGEIQWHVTISRLISDGNLKPFQRREYRRFGQEYDNVNDWNDPHVYVLYTGVSSRKGQYECFDLANYCPPKQHGNTKNKGERAQEMRLRELLISTPGNTPVKSSNATKLNVEGESDDDDFQVSSARPYIRTNFAVRHAMKMQLQGGAKPMVVQECVKRKALQDGATANNLPRNRQQVYDCKRKLTEEAKVQDPLWEVFKFAQTHAEIIPTAGISEEKAYAAVFLPAMVDHVNEILSNRAPMTLHYDTTYNVGQYFVSILAFKHPHLQNQPVLPLGFLFHQSKATDVHSIFMQVISQKVPKLNSKLTVFVSDREAAIRTAIRSYFPEAYMAACHDHLTKNITNWMKARRMATELEKKILKDIKSLLRATSQEEFVELEGKSVAGGLWPEEFSSYYQRNLQADIIATSRFKTEPMGVYYPNAGVSNNSSESMNFIYKHFTEVEKRPKTWLEAVQKAYLLMADKYNDVYLAVKLNTGDFKASNQALEVMKNFNLSPHIDSLGSEGFELVFSDGKFVRSVDRGDMSLQGLTYKHGLADWLIKMNRIVIVHGQFFVRSIGDKTHAVNYVKRECSCGTEDCIELLALDKIIRVHETQNTKKVRKTKGLTLTKANERAVSKASGKKAHIKVGVRSNIISTQQPKKRRLNDECEDSLSNMVNDHCSSAGNAKTAIGESVAIAANDVEASSYNYDIEHEMFTENEILDVVNEDRIGSVQSVQNEGHTSEYKDFEASPTPCFKTNTAHGNDSVKVSVAVDASKFDSKVDKIPICTESLQQHNVTCAQEVLRRSGRKMIQNQSTAIESAPSSRGEKLYCVCRGGDYGKMRRCDGSLCENDWYHAKCVGLSLKELNQKVWYCPKCKNADGR